MATATDLTFGNDRARSVGSGIVTAGDRKKDFRSARRHSVMVRVLRVAFPVSCVLLVAVYAYAVLDTAGWGSALPQIALPRIVPENLTMDNPRYSGFNKDGGSYVVTARTAVQDFKQTTRIKLYNIKGELTEVDKTKTFLTAKRGAFDTKRNILELYDAIDVTSESGMKAKLTRATIRTKESVVTTKEPVLVEMKAGSVRSKEMTLRQKLREVTFVDSVVAHLVPPPEDASKPATDNAQSKLLGNSKSPVDVTANRLDVKDGESTAIFTGNVIATQGEAKLTTPEMVVSYVSAQSAAPASSSALGPQASQVRRILAKGPVVMTQGAADQLTTDEADFDAINEKAYLNGNVVMTSGADRRAVGDRTELDSRNDTALMTGNVVVTQGVNVLKGRRLFIDRKAGRTRLTSPAGDGVGAGRITAHLIQSQQTKAAKPDKKPDESGASPLSTFKTDPNAPIDIESDSLDVDDHAKAAIFRGKVVAVQGGFKIEGAELEANYRGDAALADVAQGAARTGNGQPTELTRIKIRRDVVVTGSDGQSATGDWADFDPATNSATVGGDVVLTQGRNVVRGTKLLIDMASGQSTLQTEQPQTSAANGKDGWVPDTRNQNGAPAKAARPSATFYIDDAKKGAKGNANVSHPPKKPPPVAPSPTNAQGQPAWAKSPANSSWDQITGSQNGIGGIGN